MVKLLDAAIRHAEIEKILVAKTFGFEGGDESDNLNWLGQGCSVGCFARDAGYSADSGDIHEFVSKAYKYPVWAVILQDVIFERLPSCDARSKWHVDFARAVDGVTDWSTALGRMDEIFPGLKGNSSDGRYVHSAIDIDVYPNSERFARKVLKAMTEGQK